MDSSPQGSSVHRFLQTRILEWAAISFSQKKTKNKTFIKGRQEGKLSLPIESGDAAICLYSTLEKGSCSVMSDSLRSHGL